MGGKPAGRAEEVRRQTFDKAPTRKNDIDTRPIRRINPLTWEPDKDYVISRLQSSQSSPFFGPDLRRT